MLRSRRGVRFARKGKVVRRCGCGGGAGLVWSLWRGFATGCGSKGARGLNAVWGQTVWEDMSSLAMGGSGSLTWLSVERRVAGPLVGSGVVGPNWPIK